jgi:TrwC relaxase
VIYHSTSRERVAVRDHAAESEEHARHPEPGIAERAGKPSQPPERQARGRNEGVRVEEARRHDIHEKALRSALFFGKPFVRDPVTAEQMRALFGRGLHPLAELRQQQLEGPDLTLRDFQNVARLGAPFKIVDNDPRPFRLEVARRIAALNTAIGWPADASIASADRARVRTQVAPEFFRAEHGREPVDARELTGQIAKDSRPRTQTVAGYDLTFSPVKSVSTLWAVADPAVAAAIERAHQA